MDGSHYGEKFQAFYDLDPEHEMITPAKILLDALINALEEQQVADPAQEMRFLLTELAPLAKKTLAGQERDYMSLFWRRLADYIDDSLYSEASDRPDRGQDKLHTSFCYQQIPDWQAVINSIEQIPEGMQQPGLLTHYTIALKKSGQDQQYIQAVCQFFWQYPTNDQETYIDDVIITDIKLKNIWYDYQDLELDEQWGRQHFPCWLLIQDPGVGHHVIPNQETPEEFRLLQRLILTEIKENKQSMTLRKQLKKSHADMLEFYLKVQKEKPFK